MTVAPLIAMKSTKCDSLEAVGKELDRRAHTYANDVDQSGRHVGYLCRAGDESPVPLEQAIERRMGELKPSGKLGTTKSARWGSSSQATMPWTRRARGVSGQVGSVVRGAVRIREPARSPDSSGRGHRTHIWIAPVIRGEDGHDRLCAKELFAPDKRRKNADGKWEVTAQGTMSRLQEDFWEQVAKPYGYERPLRHELRAKGYRSLDAYKGAGRHNEGAQVRDRDP